MSHSVFKTLCGAPELKVVLYSNAGDKPWQPAALGGTQRIRGAISERAAAIC
jgi:hypothetical protein